ncbi:hypothetical protein C1I99_19870, partial [Micromonospora deserti]
MVTAGVVIAGLVGAAAVALTPGGSEPTPVAATGAEARSGSAGDAPADAPASADSGLGGRPAGGATRPAPRPLVST